MRHSFITFLVIAFFSISMIQNVSAQNKFRVINDWTTFRVDHGYLADTLVINSDSIYLVNKPTFDILFTTFKKAKDGNSTLINLLANYEGLIKEKDNQLKIKEEYYQKNKTEFDSLVNHTNDFIAKSTADISQISSSLGQATDNLVKTQKLLLDSEKLLEEERKNNWKRTLKVGIGGFTIGVTVGALFFLFAK
jgi:hypothetical protein